MVEGLQGVCNLGLNRLLEDMVALDGEDGRHLPPHPRHFLRTGNKLNKNKKTFNLKAKARIWS